MDHDAAVGQAVALALQQQQAAAARFRAGARKAGAHRLEHKYVTQALSAPAVATQCVPESSKHCYLKTTAAALHPPGSAPTAIGAGICTRTLLAHATSACGRILSHLLP
jgi:hypothetical protein